MSSLRVNHASVNILLAPRSPACLLIPREMISTATKLTVSAPETMHVNSHDCFDLDQNCRGKMAWGTNPLFQNDQSSDP